MRDVIIIGAGVCGSSIARNLSKYDIDVLVLDKEADVSEGTSKANSGIVHAGYDTIPGSNKAKFNVRGSQMMEDYCRELSIPYDRVGSLVLAFDDEDLETIEDLYDRGIENGLANLEIIGYDQIKEMNPNISTDVKAVLYAKDAAIMGCWEFAINSMENAMDNGVDLMLSTEVLDIKKEDDHFVLSTNRGELKTKTLVNAAGVYADDIHNMVGKANYQIRPRRGQYFLLEKPDEPVVNQIIFPTPKEGSKGILVLPTVHGNVLVGPNAEYIDDKEDVATTQDNYEEVRKNATKTVPNLPLWTTITSFSGLRASPDTEDFIVGPAEDVEGLINVAGIESPGLSSAPAIAEYVCQILVDLLGNPDKKKDFNPHIRKHPVLEQMSKEEINDLIKEDPRYGNMICSCENVSEGEVVDIINRNAGARTIDGVKRRARPGAGPCQGGFCSPKVIKILARELDQDLTDIDKRNPGSNMAISRTK